VPRRTSLGAGTGTTDSVERYSVERYRVERYSVQRYSVERYRTSNGTRKRLSIKYFWSKSYDTVSFSAS
jgi:hypothetical protein